MLLNRFYILITLVGFTASLSADTLRDPTLPGNNSYLAVESISQGQNQALVLNSIVNSGNTAYAVINNKIMSVGDSIQGVKLVGISSSSVSLSDGRKLALFQAIIER